MAALNQQSTFEDQPSIFEDQPSILDDLDEDQIRTPLSDNDASLDVALDDCSAGQNPDMITKRVKPRNEACRVRRPEVKRPAMYLPDNFRDLDKTLQHKIIKQHLCPTSKPSS